MKKDMAFSGLEAAIVLIAFVVVAAVFSYVMLGAGFFATQKSQEVTYSGIKQSTSNLVLDGQIYGKMVDPGYATVLTFEFWLTIPEGGQPQDMEKVDYVVTVQDLKYDTTKYEVSGDGYSGIMKPGERKKVIITFSNNSGPRPGDTFTLEIKPRVGASSLITKTLSTGYNSGPII